MTKNEYTNFTLYTRDHANKEINLKNIRNVISRIRSFELTDAHLDHSDWCSLTWILLNAKTIGADGKAVYQFKSFEEYFERNNLILHKLIFLFDRLGMNLTITRRDRMNGN